jgi:hypothetical protein
LALQFPVTDFGRNFVHAVEADVDDATGVPTFTPEPVAVATR